MRVLLFRLVFYFVEFAAGQGITMVFTGLFGVELTYDVVHIEL